MDTVTVSELSYDILTTLYVSLREDKLVQAVCDCVDCSPEEYEQAFAHVIDVLGFAYPDFE